MLARQPWPKHAKTSYRSTCCKGEYTEIYWRKNTSDTQWLHRSIQLFLQHCPPESVDFFRKCHCIANMVSEPFSTAFLARFFNCHIVYFVDRQGEHTPSPIVFFAVCRNILKNRKKRYRIWIVNSKYLLVSSSHPVHYESNNIRQGFRQKTQGHV